MPDWLEVTLFSANSDAQRNAQTAQLLRALNVVAERHELQAGARGDEPNVTSIAFRAGSRTTHSIEIRFARRAGPAQRETVDADAPRLAIILDDVSFIHAIDLRVCLRDASTCQRDCGSWRQGARSDKPRQRKKPGPIFDPGFLKLYPADAV